MTNAVGSSVGALAGGRAGADACPGALRLHSADDGSLARIRIPGGLLTVDQARVLAELSTRLGDGSLDLTSRGNVQLRGLPADAGSAVASRLAEAGLLPSFEHERVRNIVASPLSGVDSRGAADTYAWTRELDALLCANAGAAQLSGRFLFALDDGRCDVAQLDADVTLIALSEDEAGLFVGPTDAAATGIRVPAAEAAHWALRAALAFLELARERAVNAWRVKDIDPDGSSVAERIRLAGAADLPQVTRHSDSAGPPVLGVISSDSGVAWGLSVGVRLGRMPSAQWDRLVEIAEQAAREVRLTPWRGVVLPGVSSARAQESLESLRTAGFITSGASPWWGVSACTGLPGCAKSLSDVRLDLGSTLAVDGALPAEVEDCGQQLAAHWSGCERRCGHPSGAWIDVLATPSGYSVGLRTPAGLEFHVNQLTAHQAAAAVTSIRATRGSTGATAKTTASASSSMSSASASRPKTTGQDNQDGLNS